MMRAACFAIIAVVILAFLVVFKVIGAPQQIVPIVPTPTGDLSSASLANQSINVTVSVYADYSSIVPIPNYSGNLALIKLAAALCMIPVSPTSPQASLCSKWVFKDSNGKQIFPAVP